MKDMQEDIKRQHFVKPDGMLGVFGVVKLWPGIKTAEDENIARIKSTALSLGLKCIEIDDSGHTTELPRRPMTQADLDFVIHLHFQTPKAYDIFSFVTLWNPLQFYHEWDYGRFSRNLLTHDDFLSCDAPGADHMIARMIASDPTRAKPEFTLFHSLSEPILEPTLGDRKLFYIGINWERLGKGRSRHQEILDALDATGDLRIYGPRIFQGVRVWDGYKSYVDELPFDGTSSIATINKAGIVLVLSSEAHKQSGLMSNRLFEALAGGAVAICDENAFARKHFGDTVLYIDTTLPTKQVAEQINAHVAWVKNNPHEALGLARRAQAIFNEKFRLDVSLCKIYSGLTQRRQELERLYAPKITTCRVTLYLLLPDYSPEALRRQITNFKTQRYPACRAVLVVDSHDARKYSQEIYDLLEQSSCSIALETVPFYARKPDGTIRIRLSRGQVLANLLRNDTQLEDDALYSFIAPNEILYSNHVQALVGALETRPDCTYAFSHALLQHKVEGAVHHELTEKLLLTHYKAGVPPSYGRMLFRHRTRDSRLDMLLPYLDIFVPLGLTNLEEGAASPRATIAIDIQDSFNIDGHKKFDERNILRDQNPTRFDALDLTTQVQDFLKPQSLSLQSLSIEEKRRMLMDLLRSIPIPDFVRAIIRPPLRLVFRLYRHRRAR